MTGNTTAVSEREEIEMLVPFYVTGRIAAADARRVDDYLRRNPDFAEHIELARDERAATVSVNEALGFPSARSADRVFEAIAAERPPQMTKVLAQSRGLLAKLQDFFSAPTAGAVRYAAFAAAVIVLAQAAILGTMLVRHDATGSYETASGGKETPAAGGPVVLIAFENGAALADISRVLEGAGGTIVEGPLKGGLYRVRLTGSEAVEQRLEALKAEKGVVKMLVPSR